MMPTNCTKSQPPLYEVVFLVVCLCTIMHGYCLGRPAEIVCLFMEAVSTAIVSTK